MRIEKLSLENFRSHASAALEFDRYTFITGANGSGKSSIAAAIQFLLTGACEFTDRGGRGADALIRTGAKKFDVVGKFSETFLARMVTLRGANCAINSAPMPCGNFQPMVEKLAHTSTDVLAAVLSSSRFLQMKPPEQKELLTRALADEGIEIAPEIRATVERLLKEPGICKGKVSLTEIEAAYEQIYAARTETNREVKALGEDAKPEKPADTPSGEAVKKKLEGLRGEYNQLVREKATKTAGALRNGARRKELQQQVDRLASAILSDEEEARIMAIHAKAGELADLRNTLRLLENELDQKKAKYRELDEAPVTCPTCERPITKKNIKPLLEQLAEEISDIDAKMAGVIRDMAPIADAESAGERLEMHRNAVADHLKATKELQGLAEVTEESTSDLDVKAAEINNRIQKGESVLQSVTAIETRLEMWEKQQKRRDALQATVTQLEQLIAYFGPDGVRKKMTGSKWGKFTSSLAKAISDFDFGLTFSADPFEIRVGTLGRPTLELKQLSESEQFRFGVAFQVALAKVTGVNFVVIDRADVLDATAWKQLLQMVVSSELEQAIVLATSSVAVPKQYPAGVRFIELGGVAKEAAA